MPVDGAAIHAASPVLLAAVIYDGGVINGLGDPRIVYRYCAMCSVFKALEAVAEDGEHQVLTPGVIDRGTFNEKNQVYRLGGAEWFFRVMPFMKAIRALSG